MPILGVVASSKSGRLNSFESIETIYVASGTQANITFSSIPQTYKHLMIRATARTNSGGQGDWVRCEFNGISGASTYFDLLSYSDGGGQSGSLATSAIGAYALRSSGVSSGSAYMGMNVMELLDYTATNKIKTFKYIAGHSNNTGSSTTNGQVVFGAGVFNNTAAVTQLKFFSENSGSFTAGTRITLYGIKGS
jgi:hypothetical protein